VTSLTTTMVTKKMMGKILSKLWFKRVKTMKTTIILRMN